MTEWWEQPAAEVAPARPSALTRTDAFLAMEGADAPTGDELARIVRIVDASKPRSDDEYTAALTAEFRRRNLIRSYGHNPDVPVAVPTWRPAVGWSVWDDPESGRLRMIPGRTDATPEFDVTDAEGALVVRHRAPDGAAAIHAGKKNGHHHAIAAVAAAPVVRPPYTAPNPGEWLLDRAGTGAYLNNLNNAIKVLEKDANLQGLVWYDEFLQRILTGAAPSTVPNDSAILTPGMGPREWGDVDDINLCLYLQRDIGLRQMTNAIVHDAVIRVSHDRMRHCVRDWIDGTKWDGTERIGHFFPDHFGCDDNAYTRAASSNFWISMAARIWEPGCKVDNMVVLEGEQGHRKSSALAAIGGAWFAEQHESVTSKDFYLVLQGKLLIEVGEMDSFSRGEVTRVKQVITCASDRYRTPYGRHAKDWPRSCVFVGTTNKDDWHRDETGARRFWPIRCQHIDTDAIKAGRPQLFAEATARFKAGTPWWIMPDAETKAEQGDRFARDVWHDPIAAFVAAHSFVTVGEILAQVLQIPVGKQDQAHQRRVGSTLRALGWKASKSDGGKAVWRPGAIPPR